MSASTSSSAVIGRGKELASADRTVSFAEARDDLFETAGVTPSIASQASRIISVVVIATVALIGTLIMGEVYSAIDFEGAAFETDGALEDVPDGLLEGFGSAINFVPIILIVLLAALVISVVSRMGE